MVFPNYQIPGNYDQPQGVEDASRYGILGNGVSDDASNLQTAINNTPAGGVLRIPPGRYVIGSTLTIPHPMTIIGPGRYQQFGAVKSQLYLASSANCNLLNIAALNVTIRDLGLYGNKGHQSSTSHGIVGSLTTPCNYFVLDNVWVDSFYSDNIYLQNSQSTVSCILTNVESRLSGGAGIYITSTANDVIINGGYLDQNEYAGLILDAVGDVLVQGTHIWGNGTSGTTGDVDGITLKAATNLRAIGCYIEQNTNGRGIFAKTGANKRHQVVGCYITNNGQNGIDLFGSDHCVVTGNTIYRNNFKNASGSTGAGIFLDECVATLVNSNVIWDASPRQTYGFYGNSNNTDCIFANNVTRAADHLTGSFVAGTGVTATGNQE